MQKREPFYEFALKLASLASERSTCARSGELKKRGAIAVDENNRIVSMGWNGVPQGFTHCTDVPCKGANQPAGGSSSDDCIAVHSEINCIINAHSPKFIYKMYVTHSPCLKCALALANLPNLKELYYREEYADTRGLNVLKKTCIKLYTFNINGTLRLIHC